MVYGTMPADDYSYYASSDNPYEWGAATTEQTVFKDQDYKITFVDKKNGRYVYVRDKKGHIINNYKYDWGKSNEDNFRQANNIVEEREEADREKAEKEESKSWDIPTIRRRMYSENHLGRKYQFIIHYEYESMDGRGEDYRSYMTNTLWSNEELLAKFMEFIKRHYHQTLVRIIDVDLRISA